MGSFELARIVDLACDEFEAAWNRDANARIETFLDSLPAHVSREQALRSLLPLELELRQNSQQRPQVEEFVLRFPEDRAFVTQAFEESCTRQIELDEPSQISHYAIEGRLGTGSFGTVYLAHDTQLDRRVALKVLHRWYAEQPSFVERFRREAQAIADLNDPNICQVFGIGESEGRQFYVMQYCGGGSLSDWIEQAEQSPKKTAVAMVVKLARAMDRVHQKGLVHRDLKPANILLDDNGEPVISDFGLVQACSDEENPDESALAFGTPTYMAPERFKSPASVLPSQDVYSLGIILLTLLSGRSPDGRDDLTSHATASASRRIPGRRLTKICSRATSAQLSERYRDAAEFAVALEAWERPICRWPLAFVAVACSILLSVVFYSQSKSIGDTSPPPAEIRFVSSSQRVQVAKPGLYDRTWSEMPVPLSQWTQDRRVLTVSQDGSGMYASIAEAIEALTPNAMVKILDRGPYLESLIFKRMPSDIGIVSEVGTVVQIPEWHQLQNSPDNASFVGCNIDCTKGFRVSGIHFVAPPSPKIQSHRACLFRIRTTGARRPIPLIIEGCEFSWDSGEDWSNRKHFARPEQLLGVQILATRNSAPVYLTNSRVEETVVVDVDTPAMLIGNVVESRHSHRGISITPSLGQNILVKDNRANACVALQIGFRQVKNFDNSEFARPKYRIVGNAFEGDVGLAVRPSRPEATGTQLPAATIQGNEFNTSVGLHFTSTRDAEEANERWEVEGNEYANAKTNSR